MYVVRCMAYNSRNDAAVMKTEHKWSDGILEAMCFDHPIHKCKLCHGVIHIHYYLIIIKKLSIVSLRGTILRYIFLSISIYANLLVIHYILERIVLLFSPLLMLLLLLLKYYFSDEGLKNIYL